MARKVVSCPHCGGALAVFGTRASAPTLFVQSLFDAGTRWSVNEILDRARREQINGERKDIYNALGYLVRAGIIRRIARGEYCGVPRPKQEERKDG